MEILESVLEEFSALTKIPRPSGHEKQVSDYLCKRLQELGLTVEQDENFNVIGNLPATPGLENIPTTILQGHMDMVCVASDGVEYNPLTDPIKTVRSEKFLQAVGTSLGADDGIGVSIILHVLKTIDRHGPIRVIFTTDEETGMSGARNLDPKYLTGAKYMINCDSENYDEVTVSSAGSVCLDFSKSIRKISATAKNFFEIKIDGLLGGHSGERIHENRANAIRLLAFALVALKQTAIEKTIAMNIVNFNGGVARNAIPASATAVISTDLDFETVVEKCEEVNRRFLVMYDIDLNIKIHVKKAEPQNILKPIDAQNMVRLLTIIHSGVYAMVANDKDSEPLVETSANLGLVSTNDEKIEVSYFPRSCIDEKLDSFCQLAEDVSDLTSFELTISNRSPGWKRKMDSVLTQDICDSFKKLTGREMKIKSIHAGLECGYFVEKNPELDVVSIGTTNEAIHSPQEKLHLDTVEPQVNLILETLKKIAGE